MADIVALGKLVVPTSGAPVAFTSILPADQSAHRVHAFLIEALPGNTGKVYFGKFGTLNKATLAGVIIVLPAPTTNQIPTFSCSITAAANPLRLDDKGLDVDNANDGVLVSAIIW